jgi:hypothetical protein
MKFNLGFIKNKKNISIILLLLSIFISLALSQFQYIQSLKKTRENFIEASNVKTYEMMMNVATDKNATVSQKLNTIRGLVDMMPKLDKKDYLDILDNSKLTDDEKLIEVKKFKPIGLDESKLST